MNKWPKPLTTFFRLIEQQSEGDDTSRKPLTIHMLNHYLSKPAQYPLPAFYLYAVQAITG
ncbi:MAG: hypothetical protein JRD68_01975 [Deltaproteobacteria bacterium]|nr:hypothetical protein [Deltaproteobacteria bacterium]